MPEDRIFGGSMEPRFNPRLPDTRLNARLGPERPSPLVRETSSGEVRARNASRRLIGLPGRLERGQD